jgi:pyruvate,water dikinase
VALVLPLARAPGPATVGGKGASLGELIRAGIRVPPGFVITVDAFTQALAAIDPTGERRAGIGTLAPDDLSAIMTVTESFRLAIATAPLPAQVAAAVREAYAALGDDAAGQDTAVAVRSSATMEDGVSASFAGLQDTYLGVRGACDVLDAVGRCWASLYNDESVAYRRRIGLAEESLSMAVVVQVMVAPRAAGVMFTRSPVSGDRSVVAIEGVPGLGDALVSGEVTPDGFVIGKITGEITSRRVAGAPCLADDEIRALAAVGALVEAHYGRPQDIEWAIDDGDGDPSGRITVLQSRPETVWAARDAAATDPVAAPKPRPADHVLALFVKPQRKGAPWS